MTWPSRYNNQLAFKKAIRLATGVGMVMLGVTGLILPIMPGWIFLIPGLIILADFFPSIHRLLEWAKRKAAAAGYPSLARRKTDRARSGMTNFLFSALLPP